MQKKVFRAAEVVRDALVEDFGTAWEWNLRELRRRWGKVLEWKPGPDDWFEWKGRDTPCEARRASSRNSRRVRCAMRRWRACAGRERCRWRRNSRRRWRAARRCGSRGMRAGTESCSVAVGGSGPRWSGMGRLRSLGTRVAEGAARRRARKREVSVSASMRIFSRRREAGLRNRCGAARGRRSTSCSWWWRSGCRGRCLWRCGAWWASADETWC